MTMPGTTIKPILQHPHDVLRLKCMAIAKVDDEARRLGGDLLNIMRHHNAAGLSAPQIGVPARIVVITGFPFSVLINPEIHWRSPDSEAGQEGCLSVGHGKVFFTVKRAKAIKFSFADRRGALHTMKSAGFTARLIQHELDHLDGVLVVDHPQV